MSLPSRRTVLTGLDLTAANALAASSATMTLDQRDDVAVLRGPFILAFHRHNRDYRVEAAMRFFHSKRYDLLRLTLLDEHAAVDARFDQEAIGSTRNPQTVLSGSLGAGFGGDKSGDFRAVVGIRHTLGVPDSRP